MQQIVLDAAVSEIAAELGRRGIAAHTRVHIIVELADEILALAHLAHAGKAFDWLAEEPDLYADADLVERGG